MFFVCSPIYYGPSSNKSWEIAKIPSRLIVASFGVIGDSMAYLRGVYSSSCLAGERIKKTAYDV